MVPRTCLFIFDAGSRRLGSNNFGNSSYNEKTAGSARVSRLSFGFLWLWSKAYDCIPHDLLLAKLNVYGIDSVGFLLISDYLSRCKQRKKIG